MGKQSLTRDTESPKYEDAFGTHISQGTQNELDIASQYNFSPERVRLFRNGSREFPQYNTISQFNDGDDVWQLQPDAGDTMHIESAESGTYVVNYVLQASFAFSVNQSLTNGDKIRVGPYNGTDGWVIEQRGSDHSDTQVDIIESRDDTETTLASDVKLPKPITDWNRHETRYNWYNVGNQVHTQTYTQNGEQINDELKKTSNDGDRGPKTGNLNLWQEVQADSGTSNLQMNVGSMGSIVLGEPTVLTRDKPQLVQETVSGTAGAWEPIYAIRVDPDNSDVNARLTSLQILDYGANDDIELVVVSVDASKTDASGWSEPGYHHSDNSALQSTTSISEVPNTSGTQTDLGASEKFGGHTLAAAADIDAGIADGTEGTSNESLEQKKKILNSDHVVFLARTDTMDSVLSFVWDADQNW